ncbi:MAG: redoxin domain-containing protein [Chloroflexi bacterium]|nr:redoxin domain-containing protein [Chloroflexota bacterium]
MSIDVLPREPAEVTGRAAGRSGSRVGRVLIGLGLLSLVALGLAWGMLRGMRASQPLGGAARPGIEAAPGAGPDLAPASPDTAGLSTGIVVEGRASLGEPAPEFRLETVAGDHRSLSDFAGQPLLLNFWATWCAPCRAEMPYLEAVYAKHADEGLVVLGVNVQEPTAVVAPYLDELGLTFPVLLDLDGDVSRLYRVGSYPTSVLVDREGRIVTIRRGAFVNEPDINLSLSMIMPELD